MQLLLVTIVAGVLLGIGSRFPSLWMLSLVSFLPFAYVLMHTQSTKKFVTYAFVTGVCAYGLSFHALFWDSLPLTWLGVSGFSGVLIIVIIWTITTLLFATIFGLAMMVARTLLTQSWQDIFIIPAAYALGDWLGAWGFSIVNYGPHALLGPHFTMGSPGYQLAADGVLLQTAWVGGLYTLLFMQAGIGLVLFRLWYTKQRGERTILLMVVFIGVLVWSVGTYWISHSQVSRLGEPLQIALIGIYEPSVLAPTDAQLAASYKKLSALVTTAASSTPDIIALPESSQFLDQWHKRATSTEVFGSNIPKPTIIDSTSVWEGDTLYSRTEFFSPMRNVSSFTYKRFLMPLGEEHPYLYQIAGRLIGQGDLVHTLLTVRGFGTRPVRNPVIVRGVHVAALLCSEGMSPSLYADQARRGAQVFFNLASHTWFHESRTMHILALWNGKVRAVESRRWYARPADDSPIFVIGPYGRTVAMSAWDKEQVLRTTVYARDDVTPYMVYGQWVLLLFGGIVLKAYYQKKHKVARTEVDV